MSHCNLDIIHTPWFPNDQQSHRSRDGVQSLCFVTFWRFKGTQLLFAADVFLWDSGRMECLFPGCYRWVLRIYPVSGNTVLPASLNLTSWSLQVCVSVGCYFSPLLVMVCSCRQYILHTFCRKLDCLPVDQTVFPGAFSAVGCWSETGGSWTMLFNINYKLDFEKRKWKNNRKYLFLYQGQ